MSGHYRPMAKRLARLSAPCPVTGCVFWLGHTSKGYGVLKVLNRTTWAHRVSYLFWKGPIPDDLTVDHRCGQPLCINPDHLEAVTMRENILRGNGCSTRNARKTHCVRGHAFSGDNLCPSQLAKGKRRCVACSIYQATKRRRRRAVEGNDG